MPERMKVVKDPKTGERNVPATDADIAAMTAAAQEFTLERGSAKDQPETEWVINGLPFDHTKPLAQVERGDTHVWIITNGGGGWVHPMHLHQEEHHVLTRHGERGAGRSPPGRHRERWTWSRSTRASRWRFTARSVPSPARTWRTATTSRTRTTT